MPVNVQIRNMPDEWHRILKSRAAAEGKSLSEYLLAELRFSVERPTIAEMRARLATLEPIDPPISPADSLEAEREAR